MSECLGGGDVRGRVEGGGWKNRGGDDVACFRTLQCEAELTKNRNTGLWPDA